MIHIEAAEAVLANTRKHIAQAKRGSTGGTPGYGTQGGYSQSKPANRSGGTAACAKHLPRAVVLSLYYAIKERRHAPAS